MSGQSGKTAFQVRWRLLPRGKWTEWQYCDRETYDIGSDEGLEVRLTPLTEPRAKRPNGSKVA